MRWHPGRSATEPNGTWTADFIATAATRSRCRTSNAAGVPRSPGRDNRRRDVTRLFRRYGLPERIRTDNALRSLRTLWVGCLGCRCGLFNRELIEPGCPQQGKHENMRPNDAADIVQRTLVSGFQKLNRCRDPERVGGWLFRTQTIAANLCKDFLKSPRRADVSLEAASATVIDRSRPDADLEREELKDRVEQALERLSPEQREAFILKHLEGRSYGEMATLLGASKSALKMRVLRAREELQTLLKVYQ